MAKVKLIIATYIESMDDLHIVCRMARSLRTFGGKFSSAPVWAFTPVDLTIDDEPLQNRLQRTGVELKNYYTPAEARWLNYAGKPYAAAEAEALAEETAEILAWVDEDTIFLSEPAEFDLETGQVLAYHPVMHNRSGSLFDQPPDLFWSRIFEKTAVTEDLIFSMITPADRQKIRAYFQAGVVIVRPERNIMRHWARNFELLYKDSVLTEMCRVDNNKRIFLHQTALVGAVLHNAGPGEMVQLTDGYNYPLFFEKQYGAKSRYDSIENAVTVRIVVSPESMGINWERELAGPPDKIAWLRANL